MNNETHSVSYSGSSFGVLSLLTRWFSVAMIIFISESLLKFGIMGVIGIILSIVGTFFVFGFVTSRGRMKFQESHSLYEVVCLKTTGLTKKIMGKFFLILSVGMIFLQIIAIDFVFSELFDIPLYISKSIVFIVLLIYILLIGDRKRAIIEPLYVIILFSAVIFIPAYFFIQKGIQPVYEGIWLYHPYLLFWKNYDSIFFIPTFFLVFFSILLVDRMSWKQLFSMKTRKVGITMALTGLTLGTLLLPLIAIMFISLSYGSFDNTSTIIFEIINYLNPMLLLVLFVCFSFIVCIKAIVVEFNILIDTMKEVQKKGGTSNGKSTKKIRVKKIIGLLMAFTIVTMFYRPDRLMDAIFIYGLFSVSMITPMLIILFKKQHISSLIIWAVGIGFIGGLFLANVFGMLFSIWTSFLLSTLLSLLVFLQKASQ